MTPETKRVVLAALHQYLGDNHLRAGAAFRGFTPQQMREQHGQSGMTRQELLDDYLKHADAVKRALEEVETL